MQGILIILISCFLLTGTAAAQGIQAYMGDTIPLSGYSPSSPFVYLFLTGPNLPENGVALNNINLRADQGGFTRVAVDGSNDMWSYKWGTNSLGGRLDEGTYTVWVVNEPEDRSNLGNAEYATISVTLGSPTPEYCRRHNTGRAPDPPGQFRTRRRVGIGQRAVPGKNTVFDNRSRCRDRCRHRLQIRVPARTRPAQLS